MKFFLVIGILNAKKGEYRYEVVPSAWLEFNKENNKWSCRLPPKLKFLSALKSIVQSQGKPLPEWDLYSVECVGQSGLSRNVLSADVYKNANVAHYFHYFLQIHMMEL